MAKGEKSQSDKFRDLARELETDESEEAFDDKLRRVVKAPLTEADQKQKPGGHPAKNNRPEDQ
jgi:hypothetical protein